MFPATFVPPIVIGGRTTDSGDIIVIGGRTTDSGGDITTPTAESGSTTGGDGATPGE